MGPQLQFRAWLLKHPHIFDVQGELVGLRDGISAMATSTIPRKAFDTAATAAADTRVWHTIVQYLYTYLHVPTCTFTLSSVWPLVMLCV